MTTSSNRSSTVGIVTTVWSYEEYLPGWCKSIRALERQPDKVVVAAHNAENVVSIMASELPQAIVVPVEEEFTLAHYLNKAVEVCDTDWVGWIGADDRYRPTAFNGIDECKSDIISFGMKYSDNGREWHYGNDLHNCFFYNPVPCGSPFVGGYGRRFHFKPSYRHLRTGRFGLERIYLEHLLKAQADEWTLTMQYILGKFICLKSRGQCCFGNGQKIFVSSRSFNHHKHAFAPIVRCSY